ncbi:EexN family lipoprotein [Bradyrhizobium sp. USDA 3458]|uniref:EexN family lipoprotein n=1 Tax=Bradyrhizobium sp. USDA 3458 TaxID=2591461 RepID=UPI0011415A2D|nr:EexN family lipoprotein [Bradyrhizobium sp. USDA 3458]
MKTRLAIVLLTVAAAALTGCNDANEGKQVRTVAWFLDHRDELATALKACRDNPGERGNTPDCINANEARKKAFVKEMKDALK